jgi:hypothetical protein
MNDASAARVIPHLIKPEPPRHADGAEGVAGDATVLCVCPRESHDLALAAEHVLGVYQKHRQRVMGSPDWNERDRAAFDWLDRAVSAFWSRKPDTSC